MAADLCAAMGARRAIRLNVAGAFHTELMRPAAERMAAELSEAPIRAPRCPVVANVTGRPAADPDEIRHLLVDQIVSPVRWVDCMRWFIAQGVEQYCEVGPGRVLQGLLKRIDPSVTCSTINRAQDVRTCAERKPT
jgi:[acyl-carrier-protein] S-malonyltransferase